MENSYSGIVEELPGAMRLDRYIAESLKLLSRSQIKSRMLQALLNGKPVKLSRPVKTGDTLELSWLAAAPLYLEPEAIPLDIIYEDDFCAVINKAQGMVVHPGAGNHTGTLANALLWRRLERNKNIASVASISSIDEAVSVEALVNENVRAGIVHRLDKDTSGVIITAYDDNTLAMLSAQFKGGSVRKHYLALVRGTPREKSGSICTRLARDERDRKRFTALPLNAAGKIARTLYRVLKSWGDYSLLLVKPKTGRTHQIRVHLKFLGHPILGDPLYGGTGDKRFPNATLMLHARSLSIVLPQQHEQSYFKAPLPKRFKEVMGELR